MAPLHQTTFVAFISYLVIISKLASADGTKHVIDDFLATNAANHAGKVVERILGGSEVPISTVPYQVSLRVNGSHICGGSVLSANYVLTAAHCLPDGVSADQMRVVTGTALLNAGGNVNEVESAIGHPNYNNNTLDYDIAVIKVKTSINMSENVAPIALPAQGFSAPAGSEAVISGWGLTNRDAQEPPNALQYAKVTIANFRRCKLRYFLPGRTRLTKRMVCAGSATISSCEGDSGGALVVNNVEVGITSFGPGACGTGRLPGVYTNVADPELRQWISANTNGL